METLRIHLFGRLHAQRGQITLSHLSMRRVGALLACLALGSPHPVPREELLALLWPEEPVEISQNRLRVLLSALRKRLESDATAPGTVLVAGRTTVQIVSTAFTSDYHDFLNALQAAKAASGDVDAISCLENAVALYRGEFLAGYSDEWVLAERTQLATMHYQAVRDLVRLLTKIDAPERAIEYARLAIVAEPFDEEAHSDLIGLYHEVGQPSAALRQYEQLKRLLLEEMQAQPSTKTRELAARIEAGMGHGVKQTTRTVRPMALRASERTQPGPISADTLPPRLTSFIARTEEIAHLRTILSPNSSTRLVTLLGPGGMGKTRLAIEAAEQLKASYGGRVYFAPLAEIVDPAHFGHAIAKALRLPPTAGLEPLAQALAALNQAPALLVLDNMEQLVPEVAPHVEHLLFEAPSLRCLLTSRRAVGIEGEQEIVLGALPQPVVGAGIEELSTCPAIALFVDRVRLVRSDFDLTAHNAEDVTQLCRALEGLPLAIELAAARSRVMTPGEMRQQTGRLLNLLVNAQGGKTARHRSVRATLEWSFRLLTLHERRFFSAISVFAGGFSAAAAGYVALGESAEPGEAIATLERLRAASLLNVTSTSSETTRFGMLETLREFGMERLAEMGCEPEVRARHLAYFTEVLWKSGSAPGSWNASASECAVEEDGNLREALEFGLRAGAAREEQECALRLAGRLSGCWDNQGRWSEGRGYLRRALSLSEATERPWAKLDVLRGAGILANQMGDHEEARLLSEEGLGLALATGDAPGTAGFLRNLGSVAFSLDDYAGAQEQFERALQIYNEIGDATNIAACLLNLSSVAFFLGDHSQSRERLEDALSLYRQAEDRHGIASALLRLGNLMRNQSYFAEGRAHLIEAMEIFRETGRRQGVANCLHGLALISDIHGDHESALAQYTQAMEIFQEIGSRSGVNACIFNLGSVAQNRGDIAAATSHYRDVMQTYRKIGDRRNLAACLLGLGNVALSQSNVGEALSLYSEALTLEQQIGSRGGIANCLAALGRLALEQNEFADAQLRLTEALEIYMDMNIRAAIADVLDSYTTLAQRTNRAPLAARLAGAVSALRRETGYVRSDPTGRWGEVMDSLRTTLGEAAFTLAWRRGEELLWTDAAAEALHEIQPPSGLMVR